MSNQITDTTMTDLFNIQETLPENVREILDRYNDMDASYITCQLLERELAPLGYSFEWGLDGTPSDLTKCGIVHINRDLLSTLLTTNDFCGNMHQAFKDWCAENDEQPTDEYWCKCLKAFDQF